MPLKVIELFESWQGNFGWHCNIDFWRLVPHCLMWCIWRERNARCFEGCERSLLKIKSFFLHTLLVWCRPVAFFLFFSYSYLIIVVLGLDFLPPQYIPNVLMLAIFFLIKFIRYLSKKKKNFQISLQV